MATAIEKAYQEFNQKDSKQQNTSDVPAKDFKYKDPYTPSATAGILGLVGAGVGAVALRNPIGRALDKMSKFVLPKIQPPAPSREVVDEVTSIVKSAPDKVARGKELVTMEQAKKTLSEMDIIKLKSDELRRQAFHNPLSYGGNKKDGMGSALWDYIARNKSHKPRKAEDWIKDLTSKGPGRYSSGNPDFKSIDQAVKRDELWDSNLLHIDKDGRVVGGFLKYAQDKNLDLTKMDLIYIINKSPINQIKTKRYQTSSKFVDQADRLGSEIKNASMNAETKLLSLQNNFADNPEKQGLIANTINYLKELRNKTNKVIASNDRNHRQGYMEEYANNSPILDFSEELTTLKKVDDKLRQNGINIGEDFTTGITRATQTNTSIKRGHEMYRQDVPGTKYGGYNEYRVPGGLSYHEDVAYYPKELPFGLRVPSDFNKHYSELPNQIYHIRYQMRQGLNPRERIISIDEIQSDYHQKLNKVDPKRLNVVNPFGGEVEFFSSNRKMEKIMDQMKAISDKGRAMTKQDMVDFYNLRKDFYEVQKNTLNMANMVERTLDNASDKVPYLPLYGKENWGMHALKNTIKESIKRNDADWIVVNPVERLHHAKRTKYLGDLEFYGNSKGKAGFKDYGKDTGVVRKNENDIDVPIAGNTDPNKEATLPNMMKKLARQYNSEVKTIEVAKSDVTKPFKVVRTPKDLPKQFGLSKDDSTEHLAAFRSKDEAQAWVNQNSGKVELIQEGDPRLYYKAFGLRISEDMKNKPFKAYNEGGLVVNIFA